MTQTSVDTLVIGAGPYGLSLSAHLSRAAVNHKIVGKKMDAWARMPKGMCLRSPARASSLSDPDGSLTLEAFHAERGMTLEAPVPLQAFIDYGHWFAERAGVDVDSRLVTTLSSEGTGFVAEMEDGEVVRARRVAVAAGADAFQWTPPEFRELPADLASHPGDHDDFAVFAGKEVIVLGIGQSGVECAALLAENGAAVRVIARAQQVRWLTRSARLHRAKFISSVLYSPADVGPAGLSRIVGAASFFRQFPAGARIRMTARCARPAAAAWLIPRTATIPFETAHPVRSVTPASGRISVACRNGDTFEADHLLLATGYQVDLGQYSFIAPELMGRVKRAGGFPVLNRGFTSSVPGLHFVGWPSTWAYGPLMRHVVGADFSSRAVTAHLVGAGSAQPQFVNAEVQPVRSA